MTTHKDTGKDTFIRKCWRNDAMTNELFTTVERLRSRTEPLCVLRKPPRPYVHYMYAFTKQRVTWWIRYNACRWFAAGAHAPRKRLALPTITASSVYGDMSRCTTNCPRRANTISLTHYSRVLDLLSVRRFCVATGKRQRLLVRRGYQIETKART